MKAKILSFVFCIAAFAVSMILMLDTIDPSATNPSTETGEMTLPTEETGEIVPGTVPETNVPVTPPPQTVPVTPEMTASDAAEIGKAAEELITRLAYDGNKEYKESITSLVSDLRKASEFLDEKAGNLPASLYYSNLADVFEDIIVNPFTDMASFSSRVGTLLTRLDSMYPADAASAEASKELSEGQVATYFPKFDTDISGAFSLALLSVYSGQTAATAPGKLTVTVGGNLILGDNISTSEDSGFGGTLKNKYQGSFRYPLYRVSPLFCTDDLSIVSLENPLTKSINMKDGIISVKGSPDYVKILTGNGIEAVTMTTQHIMDYNEEGLDDTIANLNEAGITNASEKAHIAYREVNGIKVAIISYNLLDTKSDFKDKPKLDIAQAKADGAQFIIAAFNWGNGNTGESIDYSSTIAGSQARTARAAINNGASMVVGSHPHIMQALEKYKGKPIIYSNGDLSYAAQLDSTKASSDGYIFRQTFNIGSDGSVSMDGAMEVFPILSNTPENDYVPRLVLDETAKDIVDDLLQYSKSSANGAKASDISYITLKK
ncbi:MAG: CapA family protein [Ruminococcaceae bacterium]|nr:CapA family protein [Oscillospiraceae bacterium]